MVKSLWTRGIDEWSARVCIGRPRPLAIAQAVLAAADFDHPGLLHDRVVEALGS
jgi:hypothetical protein